MAGAAPARSDLGRLQLLADRLEQADAILAHAAPTPRRLAAVRALLRQFRIDDMPTRSTRALWLRIVEAMVGLGIQTVPLDEIDALSARIRVLQKAIRRTVASAH
jgi:hypothetical protein